MVSSEFRVLVLSSQMMRFRSRSPRWCFPAGVTVIVAVAVTIHWFIVAQVTSASSKHKK